MNEFVLLMRRPAWQQGTGWRALLHRLDIQGELSDGDFYPDGRHRRAMHFSTRMAQGDLEGRLGELAYVEPPIEFEPAAELIIEVTDSYSRAPLVHALVNLFDDRNVPLDRGLTRSDGKLSLNCPEAVKSVRLVVNPVPGHWGRDIITHLGTDTKQLLVPCEALPKSQNGLGWWHEKLGVHRFDENLGAGIRIGIIDTGCGPHPQLSHITHVGTWNRGKYQAPENAEDGHDYSYHGTFVCGLAAARRGPGAYVGLAPGAQVVSVRVLGPDGPPTQADFAEAIYHLAEQEKVDLVNLSWSGPYRELKGLEEYVDAASELGTLCVAAAGNKACEVLWPARFDNVVGVSAVAFRQHVPPDTPSAVALDGGEDQEICAAAFSCYGDGVTCCAPGVSLVSCIPIGPKHGPAEGVASMDGTSMAAPLVTGLLAALLGRNAQYRKLPRDRTRSLAALRILYENCRSCGLDPNFEGAGMPRFS